MNRLLVALAVLTVLVARRAEACGVSASFGSLDGLNGPLFSPEQALVLLLEQELAPVVARELDRLVPDVLSQLVAIAVRPSEAAPPPGPRGFEPEDPRSGTRLGAGIHREPLRLPDGTHDRAAVFALIAGTLGARRRRRVVTVVDGAPTRASRGGTSWSSRSR